jgi:hypothetical protein
MNTTLAKKVSSILFTGFLAVGLLSGFMLPASAPAAIGGVLPAVDLQAGSTEEPSTRYFLQFDDISFYYISSVASKVNGRTVEKSLDVNNPVAPKMDQFEFQNYAALSQIKPRINVFSAQEFMDLGGDSAIKQVEKLKLLNVSQQANPPGELPMLLGEPSLQLIRAGLQYIKFQNGSGIRYITQYGEQPWPFDNSRLFYTFQGLTDDGAWYISAVLPVNHAALEGDDGLARMQEDYTKFQTNYPAYVDYVEKQLNAEQPDTFTPNLPSLDAIIKSMVVEKKTIAPTPAKPTAKPIPTITNSPSGCTNEAAFVADVTVPDNTSFPPGASFVKTWRLRNMGTCTWTPKYQLIFWNGDAMGALATVKLTNADVPPNGDLNMSVSLTTPYETGAYQGYFKLRAPDATVFGIEPNGSNPFWVLIRVTPKITDTPTPTPTKPLIKPIKPKVTLIVPPKLVPLQP